MHKASINKVINIIIKYNHDNRNHNPLNYPSTIKTYYKMTAMSKRPLIFESVVVIQIGVHPAGEEPNNTHRMRDPSGLTHDNLS
jgi:hypothetical protein